MAYTRFTRARHATNITANGGTYTLDYTVPNGQDFVVSELFASSDTDAIKVEILYSDDAGSTWTNPWDSGSNHLLLVYLAGYIPASAKPERTWVTGDSTNIVFRVKITNNHPVNNANVFWLVKGYEK